MSYDVRPGADGAWEVVENRPVVLATCADEAVARRIRALMHLERDLEDAAVYGEGPALEVFERIEAAIEVETPLLDDEDGQALAVDMVSVPILTEDELLAKLREGELAGLAPAAEAAEPAPSPQPDADRLGAAFDRLERGEKMTAVALDLGIPFTTLRGRWASRASQSRRHAAPASAPAASQAQVPAPGGGTVVVALPASIAGLVAQSLDGEPQDQCSSCGSPFVVTVAHPDLCRRCRP